MYNVYYLSPLCTLAVVSCTRKTSQGSKGIRQWPLIDVHPQAKIDAYIFKFQIKRPVLIVEKCYAYR